MDASGFAGGQCLGSSLGAERWHGRAGAVPSSAADGLWSCWCPCADPQLFPQSYEDRELLRLIYYGGIQHEIRKAVWPFLLGHYQFGMTEAERKEVGTCAAGSAAWCIASVCTGYFTA